VLHRYNEGRTIDAVLRLIEKREQQRRAPDGRSPDDLMDPDPHRRVDYVCSVGESLYAFEHTSIEPFTISSKEVFTTRRYLALL
jgi:hypothetical protein